MNSDSFNHQSTDVIVPEQLAIACYVNGRGEVTLRQAADVYDENDSFISIAPHHAETVARAILRTAAEARGDDAVTLEAVTAGVTRNGTGASRQRRYRERQRNDGTTVTRNVTSTVAEGVTRDRTVTPGSQR